MKRLFYGYPLRSRSHLFMPPHGGGKGGAFSSFTSIVLLLMIASTATAQESSVNLSLLEWGGIPSALCSAPDLTYSAQKAADNKLDTGWVSGGQPFPVWLRMEWRFPVQIRDVAFTQWEACPVKDVGAIGKYGIEMRVDGKWKRFISGDASRTPRGTSVRTLLEQPVVIHRDVSDVLYADRNFIALHTGKQPATDVLRLPRKTPVYDVFKREVVATNADRIRLNVPAFSTALYYLGDIARFKTAVEGSS